MSRFTRWLLIVAIAVALPWMCARSERTARRCDDADVQLAYVFEQLPARTLTPVNRGFVEGVRIRFPECFGE